MKKVLIITYYWPPAGGPGVQRVLNMAQLLPEFGWEPLVLTVKNPSAPARDESLLSRIPDSSKVFKTKTSEPFEIYKKLTGKKSGEALPKTIALDVNLSFSEKISRWVRANIFIPDARKGWKKYLLKEGMRIIKEEEPELILSTSPPHSVQLAAMELAKRSGLPWVADFRDPWTEAYWESKMPKTLSSRKLNSKLEKKVLNSAGHITTVGTGIATLFQEKTSKDISVIYNGFREVDNSVVKSDYFEILHLGNLSSMQSLEELLMAIEMLEPKLQEKIKLRFIGSLAPEYSKRIDKMRFVKKDYHSFMPYEDMMKAARSASLLYLPRLNSSYSNSLISAKIFDYLALNRPILAISNKNSDISTILKNSGSGCSFEPSDLDGMKNYLKSCMAKPIKRSLNLSKLRTYSLKDNISALAKIFNRMTS